MESRADLHVHSKHSDQPTEWYLQRLGAAESYTEPRAVYDACRARGMQFVTLTDHDTIAGCLEIAHLPGTFISSEVTATFPEDGCSIHCLVFGITEKQFREIDDRRSNLYALCDHLRSHRILHAVAHPLFRVNGRMTVGHFEKLLLLFDQFEALNGSRDPRAGILTRAILSNLDAPTIERLADRHGIEPYGPSAWRKRVTAGTDDHSGLYPGTVYTATPPADDVRHYLGFLRRGEQRIAGETGSSLRLGRCLYAIAHHYYRRRWGSAAGKDDTLGQLLGRLVEGKPPSPKHRLKVAAARFLGDAGSAEALLQGAVQRLAVNPPNPATTVERRTFRLAADFGQDLLAESCRQLFSTLRRGDFQGGAQAVLSLGASLISIGPHLAAFQTQHVDERFLRRVAGSFAATKLLERRTGNRVWFLDDPASHGPAVRFLVSCRRLVGFHSDALALLTSVENPREDLAATNFPPLSALAVPELGDREIYVPPLLDILEHCERQGFDEIVVGTSGPMGWAGLLVAKILGLPVIAVHQTELPSLAADLGSDQAITRALTALQKRWLRNADAVLVGSERSRTKLAELGLEADRLHVVGPAVDRTRFRTDAGGERAWRSLGLGTGSRIVARGSLGPESRIDLLLESFENVVQSGSTARLVVIGDGPRREELSRRWSRLPVHFPGPLDDTETARLLAGADLHVALARDDELGLAVLEAAACGLASLVASDSPIADFVTSSDFGLLVEPTVDPVAEGLLHLIGNAPRRVAMGSRAAVVAQGFSDWQPVLDLLFEVGSRAEKAEDEEHGREARSTIVADSEESPSRQVSNG